MKLLYQRILLALYASNSAPVAAHRITGRDLSNGEKLRYTLDNAGRTIKTETFDAQNNLATTTTAAYDGLNRAIWRKDANGKMTSFTYDANGNVTAMTLKKAVASPKLSSLSGQ